jgi:hypothetical protein
LFWFEAGRVSVKICSESVYRQLVDSSAGLCAAGFASPEYCRMFDIDFDASREELRGGYRDFVTCCEWLSGCRYNDYATHFSPDSLRAKAKIEASSGRPVSNGSLIVAVRFLDLPHVQLGKTPNIAIAFSRFCSRFQVSVTTSV